MFPAENTGGVQAQYLGRCLGVGCRAAGFGEYGGLSGLSSAEAAQGGTAGTGRPRPLLQGSRDGTPPRRVRIKEDAASTPTLPSARSEISL